ncbi:hypothetical protein F7P69_14845 [Cellulosimicrobium funkei]|nr:hypothetical protein [Cellulosimicrobium funkei]
MTKPLEDKLVRLEEVDVMGEPDWRLFSVSDETHRYMTEVAYWARDFYAVFGGVTAFDEDEDDGQFRHLNVDMMLSVPRATVIGDPSADAAGFANWSETIWERGQEWYVSQLWENPVVMDGKGRLEVLDPSSPVTAFWARVELDPNELTEFLLRYWDGDPGNPSNLFEYGQIRDAIKKWGMFAEFNYAQRTGRLLGLTHPGWSRPFSEEELKSLDMYVGMYPDGSVQYLFFGPSESGRMTASYRDGVLQDEDASGAEGILASNPEMFIEDIFYFSGADKLKVIDNFNDRKRLPDGRISGIGYLELFHGTQFEGMIPMNLPGLGAAEYLG